jgi:hypothetical protein
VHRLLIAGQYLKIKIINDTKRFFKFKEFYFVFQV